MDLTSPTQAYLNLANEMLGNLISERSLSKITAQLPQIDEILLNELAQIAEELANSKPRHGWVLMRVAWSAAIAQQRSLFVRSLAAWYLARSANHWAQPKRVATAIAQARRGFVKLNHPGWIAACDWQLNDLAWTKPNFAQATHALRQALYGLESAGFIEFVPHCRLALAYAQILTQEYDEAKKNIAASEATFISRGDDLHRAGCWLHQANALRREDEIAQALHKLEQAGLIFERVGATVGRAKASYQAGLCYLMKTDNLPEATAQFKNAINLFSDCDLDVWRAMSVTNLGSVYLFTGDLALAENYYREARKVFVRHEIPSLIADNLHDFGEVNILRGKPQLSIEQFKRAVELYEELGSKLLTSRGMTNLGKACGQSGRYQDALFFLERAAQLLKSIDSHLRLGTCEKYIALIWVQLGQPAIAHEYLDRAIHNYELANQKALLPEAYSYRASAFILQGMEADAIECFEKSLAVAEMYGVRPQAIQARRLLGEAMVHIGRHAEALANLKLVQAESAELDLWMDHAASLVACGTCYTLTSEYDLAHNAFVQALEVSGGVLPGIEWRAQIGLGDLSYRRSDVAKALQAYRRGAETFAQIRHNFWQPVLVGSYMEAPSKIFDKVVSIAAKSDSAKEALLLAEQGKATTLLRSLLAERLPISNLAESQELKDLQAEIGLLLDKLSAAASKPLIAQATSQYRDMRTKVREKTRQYGLLHASLERQMHNGHTLKSTPLNQFDVSLFRKLAGSFLPQKWIALDYYLAGSELIIIAITPDECGVTYASLSHRHNLALDVCFKAHRTYQLPIQSDLKALGKLLIPNELHQHLTPDTLLLLAPHRKLHSVPWAALQPDFTSVPLACICVPCVIPSLQCLNLILQRDGLNHTPRRDKGLVVGLSNFRGRHPELPSVKNESAVLRKKLGEKGKSLTEEEATWERLVELMIRQPSGQKKGLAHFAWLHIASHFFSDSLTGRLSNLALWDRDIRLDQLRDLEPLPDLVTFSACNSSCSFVYEGDEHVDLPTTCLIAGANTVVGSLWPVPDEEATNFMSVFYDHYLLGLRPAQALAQTQREIIGQSAGLDNWANFVCIGAP